ncbi:MAG: HypC/HybG/HupF family hydrogenase formation chaperone [Dehalococcoidia bacterium]
MCLAVPARVVRRLDAAQALVEQEGRLRQVDVQLLPEVEVGEYVLLNLGLAVQRLSEQEAREVLDLWQQMSSFASQDGQDLPREGAHE